MYKKYFDSINKTNDVINNDYRSVSMNRILYSHIALF